MTILIGLLCEDGVVVGADGSVSFANVSDRTIEQTCKKIDILNDSMIIASTGFVGYGQRFKRVAERYLKQEYKINDSNKYTLDSFHPQETCSFISRFILQDLGSTFVDIK